MSTDKKGLALITGASSGIGRELAQVFAEHGHDLIVTGRSAADLEALGDELRAAHGVEVTVITADLFEAGAPRALYDEVRSRGLEVNYLVNDAGQGVYGPFAENDLERELATIQLNVTALVVLTKLFLRDMLARGEGRILQLGSMVSTAPSPLMAVYAGTKAFVYNFAESIISEIKDTPVTMTVLRPGATDTDFFAKADMLDAKMVREGKLGPADEVARAGYEALMRGDDAVVPGAKNKFADAATRVMPATRVADQMKKMSEPVADD